MLPKTTWFLAKTTFKICLSLFWRNSLRLFLAVSETIFLSQTNQNFLKTTTGTEEVYLQFHHRHEEVYVTKFAYYCSFSPCAWQTSTLAGWNCLQTSIKLPPNCHKKKGSLKEVLKNRRGSFEEISLKFPRLQPRKFV